ncbi:palmitoyltransferase ZDHHC23-B isoform X2 [Lepisosteus oculatus]|uniref:palmitoyltransferase ZDHHC23-B isoform X2 n=1 Tax=Lepisosteus oculatus TaxID=7918 RepID=UPI003713B2D2
MWLESERGVADVAYRSVKVSALCCLSHLSAAGSLHAKIAAKSGPGLPVHPSPCSSGAALTCPADAPPVVQELTRAADSIASPGRSPVCCPASPRTAMNNSTGVRKFAPRPRAARLLPGVEWSNFFSPVLIAQKDTYGAEREGSMKRKASRPPEEEALCCCEYVNREGERSHLLACCCDCEDLDQACDRWLRGKPVGSDAVSRVLGVVSDRLRVPWASGARKLDLTVVPPLALLPVSLHVAALHVLLGLAVLTALPVLVLWYYYVTHRKKGRTLFFLSLGLFSLAYMYFLFLTEIVPRGGAGPLQLAAVTAGVLLTLLALARTKRDPGYLRPAPGAGTDPPPGSNGTRRDVLLADGAPPSSSGGGRAADRLRRNWCPACRLVRPPRAGHCRICAACVRRLDHHCVWINSCVGQANHHCFLLTILLFLLTSLYGISLTLSALCPRQSVFVALFYCPGVYQQYSLVTGGTLHLLAVQLINVSYNVTEREARLALREKTGRRLLWGLVVDTGAYSRGFRHNWLEFLSLGGASTPPPGLADLV